MRNAAQSKQQQNSKTKKRKNNIKQKPNSQTVRKDAGGTGQAATARAKKQSAK
jgi:hypothetical protein